MKQVVHQQSILSELRGIQLAVSQITAASRKERNPVFVQRDERGLASLSVPAREFSSMLKLAPTLTLRANQLTETLFICSDVCACVCVHVESKAPWH